MKFARQKRVENGAGHATIPRNLFAKLMTWNAATPAATVNPSVAEVNLRKPAHGLVVTLNHEI